MTMFLLQALLMLLVSLMSMVMSIPAQDRPAKQRDYANLSHPANIKTVYAKVTVDKAVPLNTNSYNNRNSYSSSRY